MTTLGTSPDFEGPQTILRWEKPWLRQLAQQPQPSSPPDGVDGLGVQIRDWLISLLIRRASKTGTMTTNVKATISVAFGEGEWAPSPCQTAGCRWTPGRTHG